MWAIFQNIVPLSQSYYDIKYQLSSMPNFLHTLLCWEHTGQTQPGTSPDQILLQHPALLFTETWKYLNFLQFSTDLTTRKTWMSI